jgi:hypothetical protein
MIVEWSDTIDGDAGRPMLSRGSVAKLLQVGFPL